MVKYLFPTILRIYLYTMAFLKLSFAADTLFQNQTVANGQTLISQNQIFVMGFFTPGALRNRYYLGIWYKNTPDVVVWVANRNDPVVDPLGVHLAIANNGTLVIGVPGRVIWSSNSSGVASNPSLQLLDTGNLVVVNNTSESSSGNYIWQSFDSPCDTRLPGMKMVDDMDAGAEKYLTSWRSNDDPSPGEFVFKIENKGLPQLVTLRGRSKTYRSGTWNRRSFNGFAIFPNPMFPPQLFFNGERLISLADPYNASIFRRVRIDQAGLVQRYVLNERRDVWNVVTPLPRDQCDDYAQCGPNGICRIDKALSCDCLKGFIPRFKNQWNIQDWASGCTRNRSLNCADGDGFLAVRRVKLPDMLQFRLNTSMSLGECQSECLRNCNCTAYANPYLADGGSGCLMWSGDLLDIREVSGADDNQSIYIRLPNSELDSAPNLMEKEKKRPKLLLLIIATVSGVLLAGLICVVILLRIRQRRKAKKIEDHIELPKEDNEDLELPLIRLETIAAATNHFSGENMIGEGGFGPVYKGNLSAEEEIAVKRLSKTSRQGLEEFKNEVCLIAKLQHRNLVRLLGCCIEGEERMLIYEFLKNKSLDYFVFDEKRRVELTWPKRFEIIIGIARGLLYLHHDSRLTIIHRDLKTSNILLDTDLNPKISDFGLARIFDTDQTNANTTRVVGTYGYMAPEYAIDGRFSLKSDIFSLGVLLLEIVSGKKNRGFEHDDHHHSLLGHAWLLWKENKVLELMDVCLNNSFIESQVKRCVHVGLLCVQKFAKDRPSMLSMLSMLGNDGVVLAEPKEPGFFTERSSEWFIRSCSTAADKTSEKGTITISDFTAR